MSDHRKVIDVLNNARNEISSILVNPMDQNHALRISHSLQREINQLGLLTNTVANSGATSPLSDRLEPAKTILGVKIPEKVTVAELTPKQQQVDALKTEVNQAYISFAATDSEKILTGVSEIVIRAIAKKAGMEVTKDNPKKVTVAFIDKVKKAITEKAELHAAAVKEAEQVVTSSEVERDRFMKALGEANLAGEEAAISAAQNDFDKAVETHSAAVTALQEINSQA